MNKTLEEFKEAVLFIANDLGSLAEYSGLGMNESTLPEIVSRLVVDMWMGYYNPGVIARSITSELAIRTYMKELRKNGKVVFETKS